MENEMNLVDIQYSDDYVKNISKILENSESFSEKFEEIDLLPQKISLFVNY